MFCPQCGTQNPDNANVCMTCGAPLQQQAPAQPVYQQPVYQQPVGQQPVSGGVKAMKIVGMILGIIGFVFSIVALIYGIGVMSLRSWEREIMLPGNITWFVLSFPSSLVGLILCAKSRIATAGKVLSLLGVIFSAVQFVLMIASVS